MLKALHRRLTTGLRYENSERKRCIGDVDGRRIWEAFGRRLYKQRVTRSSLAVPSVAMEQGLLEWRH